MRSTLLKIAATTIGLQILHGAAQAQDAFYKDKRLTIIVGSAAGSGYDAYARLMARHIGRRLPGAPGVIVQNMPGGGGLSSANYLYNVAPKDGTVISALQRGMLISPLTAPQGVQYDPRKFTWLGSTTSETGVIAVWHTSPHQTIQDVLAHELLVGGSGPATDSETLPRVYSEAIGARIRIISGYKSTNEVLLAMERGEVQGIGNSSWSNWRAGFAHYLSEKKVRILMQAGLKKHPELADVPLVLDLARNSDGRQMLELFLAPLTIGRPFAAPPELSAVRARDLRSAFEKMLIDQQFIDDASKANLEISSVTGSFIDEALERLYAIPKDVLTAASKTIDAGAN
jgi:tripartite-type tricarboxylate transporter receptor subunit TctC